MGSLAVLYRCKWGAENFSGTYFLKRRSDGRETETLVDREHSYWRDRADREIHLFNSA